MTSTANSTKKTRAATKAGAGTDFAIEGMHCAACAGRVERALTKVPGVTSAQVNYATKKARVVGDVDLGAASAAVTKAGYGLKPVATAGPSADAARAEAKQAFVVSGVLTLPVFTIGMSHAIFPGSAWLQLVLTGIVLLWPGQGFFVRAAKLLFHRGVNMDTLVSLGVGSAFALSLLTFVAGGHEFYFESAAVIVTLVLLGRWLEERARQGTQEAIRKLQGMQVKTARKLESDGKERDVAIEELRPGDRFVVRPGERVALDGEVVVGSSTFDESMMTGESAPARRQVGDAVIGATMNTGQGRLVVRSTRLPSETVLAQIVSLVEDAHASKAEAQRLADLISLYFVPAVLVIALATALIWHFAFGMPVLAALYPAVAVLVIACPCALGLATPTAILAGTGRAAEDLILIRSAPGLEQTGKVDTIVFDKTGTLTEGRPRVVDVRWAKDCDPKMTLARIAAAEAGSTHPLAAALIAYAEEQTAPRAEVEAFSEYPGEGVEATVVNAGHAAEKILVGSGAFLKARGISFPDAWRDLESTADGLFFAAIGGQLAAAIRVSDPIRASSLAALTLLRSMNIHTVMATGDREATARAVATRLAIDDVRSGVLPAGKVALVQELRAAGRRVAMVGDGINDAPALAAADVGIAVGGGTDVAMDAADVVIPHGNLGKVVEAIQISRRTIRIIWQNLGWAFMYNVLAVPLAAAGKLSPMIAAGAMACSSLSVVLNSLRLKRK